MKNQNCSEYELQKIAYYDTSGNNHTVMVKDIKKFLNKIQ